MAWEYRNVLIGGQVKFAGGRWSCEALRDRRGQRVAIRYQEEVKANLDRGDLAGLHEVYYPEVWTAETQIGRRQKLGTLQVVTEKSQAPAPAPILTEVLPPRLQFVETNDVAETDLDADLLMRLQRAGYRWRGAKRTPDGRWHHLIAREVGWQRRARRERLEALIEAPMIQMTDRSDGAGPYPGELLRRSSLAVPHDQARADDPIAAALARDDMAEVERLLEQQLPRVWTWGNRRGEAHRWRPGAGGGWESACGEEMPGDEIFESMSFDSAFDCYSTYHSLSYRL